MPPVDPEIIDAKAEAATAELFGQLEALRASGRDDEAWAALRSAFLGVTRKLVSAELRAAIARIARSSEQLDPRQLELLAAEVEAQEAEAGESPTEPAEEQVADEVEQLIDEAEAETSSERRPGRRKLPDELPRERRTIDVSAEDRACPCCGGERVEIGRESREVLDLVPMRFRVLRYERIRRACPSCKDSGVVVAPTTDEQLERVLASTRLLAHVTSSKYDAHVPLHRLQRLYGHLGMRIASSTLGGWVARTAEELAPVADALWNELTARSIVGTDASGLRVLDRDEDDGVTLGTMWCYVGYPDDDGPRLCAYRYAPTGTGADGPWTHLAGRTGYVQADAANVFDRLFNGRAAQATEVGCWAHARRKLHALLEADSRVAKPLQLIAKVYRVDKAAKAKGMDAEQRLALRRRVARPHVDRLRKWLQRTARREPPASALGKACRYWNNQWDALTRFLDDGRLELDNTEVERQIRSLAVGRKNYLFAGSHRAAERAAVLYSLVRSCDLAGVPARDWIEDTLGRLAAGWPQARIDELLPHRWKDQAEQAAE